MTDITERLRSLYVQHGTDYVQEAADEIERLRDELSDAKIKLENEKLGAEMIYQENDRLMHDCQNFLNEITRLTAERDQAKEAIQTLNEGRPLGDIVGLHTVQNALTEIERLREALAELYAADLAPRDANHGRAWQNALRKAEAALRKPEDAA